MRGFGCNTKFDNLPVDVPASMPRPATRLVLVSLAGHESSTGPAPVANIHTRMTGRKNVNYLRGSGLTALGIVMLFMAACAAKMHQIGTDSAGI